MDRQSVIFFLSEAIALAKSVPSTDVHPNPRVGAVLVDSTGSICGTGAHRRFGGPHAEVEAIENAIRGGADLETCTLYVSLEPCSHHGKTPPCTDLLIRNRIPAVYFASADPNPNVHGMAVLQSNGIQAALVPTSEAIEINRPFFVNHSEQRPYVYYKSAVSKNGLVADLDGNSKWITQPETRLHAHKMLRNQVDGILTTARTVIKDRSTLNIRLGEVEKELTAIVIDRNHQLLIDPTLPILYTRNHSKLIWVTEKEQSTNSLGSNTINLTAEFPNHTVNLKNLLGRLYGEWGISKILVETGSTFGNSLLEENLIDEYWCYTSSVKKLAAPGLASIDLKSRTDYVPVSEESLGIDQLSVLHRKLESQTPK